MSKTTKETKPRAAFKQELEVVQKQSENVLEWGSRVQALVSDEEYRKAELARKVVSSVIKKLEKKRTQYTKPMNKLIKDWNADAKQAKAPYEAAKKNLNTLMLSYTAAKRQQALEEAEKIAQEAEERGEAEYAIALRKNALETTKVISDDSVEVKTWKGKVENIEELLLAIASGNAPTTLVEVNQSALNAMARAHKEDLARHLPGVSSYLDISVRGK